MVVELDQIPDCTARMSQAFEAMAMDALLFKGTDHAFNHAVLLRAMRRDELLLQTVAANKFGVSTRREDQFIVTSRKERPIDFTEGAKTGDQRVSDETCDEGLRAP